MEHSADVHLTLTEQLVAGLDRLARERGIQRARLVREVLTEYVTRVETNQTEQAMRDYADALAPHSGEFVKETDAHTVQRLLDETEW